MKILSKFPIPKEVKKLVEQLSKCWASPGNFTIRKYDEHFVVHAAIREIKGGKEDGELSYPGFDLNIAKFTKYFDKVSNVSFICPNSSFIPHILFEGTYKGHDIKLHILAFPPPGQPATEFLYNYGPKTGKVERKLPE